MTKHLICHCSWNIFKNHIFLKTTRVKLEMFFFLLLFWIYFYFMKFVKKCNDSKQILIIEPEA